MKKNSRLKRALLTLSVVSTLCLNPVTVFSDQSSVGIDVVPVTDEETRKNSRSASSESMSTKTSKPELRIPPAVTVAKPDINRSLIQLTSGLVAVLLLIGAAAWFARRFGNFHSTAGGDLRVVAGLALGARERLLVVQVADEQLLLGVAPGRVSKLHVLAKPITPKQGSGTGAGDFLEKFKAALTQRSAQGPGQDT